VLTKNTEFLKIKMQVLGRFHPFIGHEDP